MQTSRELLILVFSLFWAQILATSSRYNAFPTAAIMSERHERFKRLRRLFVSVVILNILSIVLLYVLWQWGVAENGFWGFAGAALAAPAIFGVLRLYHATVASSNWVDAFYTDEEKARYDIQGPKGEPARPFYAHFVPGILYLILWPLLAWVVGRL